MGEERYGHSDGEGSEMMGYRGNGQEMYMLGAVTRTQVQIRIQKNLNFKIQGYGFMYGYRY